MRKSSLFSKGRKGRFVETQRNGFDPHRALLVFHIPDFWFFPRKTLVLHSFHRVFHSPAAGRRHFPVKKCRKTKSDTLFSKSGNRGRAGKPAKKGRLRPALFCTYNRLRRTVRVFSSARRSPSRISAFSNTSCSPTIARSSAAVCSASNVVKFNRKMSPSRITPPS